MWCEPLIMTHQPMLFVNRRLTTTRRSRHTKSDYSWESCGHLHQATTCQHATKALEGQWATCTWRWREVRQHALRWQHGQKAHILQRQSKWQQVVHAQVNRSAQEEEWRTTTRSERTTKLQQEVLNKNCFLGSWQKLNVYCNNCKDISHNSICDWFLESDRCENYWDSSTKKKVYKDEEQHYNNHSKQ